MRRTCQTAEEERLELHAKIADVTPQSEFEELVDARVCRVCVGMVEVVLISSDADDQELGARASAEFIELWIMLVQPRKSYFFDLVPEFRCLQCSRGHRETR